MSNVTINIKNCGCGGGKSSPSSPTIPPFNDDLGDPTSPSGPPDGYSLSSSGLDDRQCKTAVWLYDWFESSLNFFGTTTQGSVILALFRSTDILGLSPLLTRALLTVIPTILALLAGPDPSDAAVGWIAWGVSGSILASLAGVRSELITQPLLVDALAKIQPQKDEIICQLSRASNAEQAIQALTDTLDNIDGLTPEQEGVALAVMPPQFFNLLFFTSDQWESFDTDYLSNITNVCCGDYVNDDPVTPGSLQSCQASWFIIEQLAATMFAVYETRGTWYNFNWFDNDRPDIYRYLENNLATPRKIRERAFNYNAFLTAITEFTYTEFVLFVHNADMTEFNDFGQYLTTNADTLTAALRAATTPAEAYTALQPLRDWIIINITADQDARTYMLQALDALIKVRDDQQGILDLLFVQDADLANYALTADCSSQLECLSLSSGGTLVVGTLTDPQFSVQATAETGSGGSRYRVWLFVTPGCGCQSLTVATDQWTPLTVDVLGNKIFYCDGSDTGIFKTAPDGTYCVSDTVGANYLILQAAGPFVATFTQNGGCS